MWVDGVLKFLLTCCLCSTLTSACDVGEVWSAAGVFGSNPAGTCCHHWWSERGIIKGSELSASGNLVRVHFHGATSSPVSPGSLQRYSLFPGPYPFHGYYVGRAAIGERDGESGFNMKADTITPLCFDGAPPPCEDLYNIPHPNNPSAVDDGKWTDWAEFPLDTSKDYIISFAITTHADYYPVWTLGESRFQSFPIGGDGVYADRTRMADSGSASSTNRWVGINAIQVACPGQTGLATPQIAPGPGECLDSDGVSTCHGLAYCLNRTDGDDFCECMPGTRDVSAGRDGTDCDSTGYAVRFVLDADLNAATIGTRRASVPAGLTDADVMGPYCDLAAKGWFMQHADLDVYNPDAAVSFTEIFCIYANDTAAFAAVPLYKGMVFPSGASITAGPRVYRWVLPTTGNPVEIPPTGLEVDTVWFKPDCQQSGCWVIEGMLTTGANLWENNAFNSFYIPRAVGSDTLSYDFDYPTWVDNTFQPVNHPCSSVDYDATGGLTQKVTSCCIRAANGFLAHYRPTQAFADWAQGLSGVAVCSDPTVDAEVIARPGVAGWYNVSFPGNPVGFLTGGFMDLSNSHVTNLTMTDPFFGQYKFEIQLDEVELRKNSGILTGTVGVEHTVDTFLGLTNFRTTGIQALDTFSTQIAIHLEKTSFFTVSTEGVNQYTFLEYVNLRLIAVYRQDKDFSGEIESTNRTVRTDSDGQINYVQVTFTLGSQYSVNEDPVSFPLIPLDSVRAGHGTFFREDLGTLQQKCSIYNTAALPFDSTMLDQECAPQAAMCVSPDSIPDSFVVFNIPLGTDFYEAAGGPSATLSNNVFVDMVISAVEAQQGALPNAGGEPMQMKTTLTASIPIVEGGINIFCDGFTAKTDLKDVANADIVVGSASSVEELTRLRIMTDIASTQLGEEAITRIDSDSIEAGLMTLVLKGNESYFLDNTGRSQVTLELEDVITIHIMEDDGTGRDDGTGKDGEVAALLAMPPDDNSDSNGLDVDGYALNGALWFWIDRSAQRAHLEPSTALLTECPFNPPRPTPGASPLETCVVRRDVRFRGFPARTGAMSTAMELCTTGSTADVAAACPEADDQTSDEAKFFTTIFGNSEYARKLGSNYARVIAAAYELNNRYRRAYFINPGYEWTPTQTGGTPIFSVSQKVYLFALVTLDEALTADDGEDGAAVTLPTWRRRMLLQSAPGTVDEALQDGEATVGGGVVEFQTSPSQLMAKAFDVPQDRVATFAVTLQLTQAEACLSDTELQGAVRATMEDYLRGAASPFHTVQITRIAVERAGVQCRRRSTRALLSSLSAATAEVTMLVVFKEGQDSVIVLDKLSTMVGIQSVAPLSVSPKVALDSDAPLPPPGWNEGSSSGGGSDDDSSTSTVAVIAGAAAGGGLLIAGIACFLYMRKSSSDSEVISAVQTINVEDLKHQLAPDA